MQANNVFFRWVSFYYSTLPTSLTLTPSNLKLMAYGLWLMAYGLWLLLKP